MDPSNLSLPTLVVSPADVSRLHRELEALDEYLHQAGLRAEATAAANIRLPKTSRLLNELVVANKLDLLAAEQRLAVTAVLHQLLVEAPVVHISFATDPSSAFMDKITGWFRQNIHPQVLIRVGLQPTLAAGCELRTPNHFYDMSLRSSFAKQKLLLIEKLQTMGEHVG